MGFASLLRWESPGARKLREQDRESRRLKEHVSEQQTTFRERAQGLVQPEINRRNTEEQLGKFRALGQQALTKIGQEEEVARVRNQQFEFRKKANELIANDPVASRLFEQQQRQSQPVVDEPGSGLSRLAGNAAGALMERVVEPTLNAPVFYTGTPNPTRPSRGRQVTLGEVATHPLLPEDAYTTIGQTPFAGETLEETARGITTPVGVASTALFPGATLYGAGAGVAGGLAGQAVEDVTGVHNVAGIGDPQSIGLGLAGAYGGPGKAGSRLATEVEGAVPTLRNRTLRNAGLGEGIAGAADDVAEEAVPVTAEDAVARIRTAIDERLAGNKVTSIEQSAEKLKRLNASDDAYEQALAEGQSRAEALRIKRGIEAGELPSATYEPIELPEDAWEAIHSKVDEFDFGRGLGPDHERDRVRSALDALENGKHIPNNELESLGRVWPDLAKTIRKNSVNDGKGFWNFMYQLAVTPKAILSSADISYPLRQGILLAAAHPIEWAKSWAPMLKTWAKESNAIRTYNEAVQDSRLLTYADGTTAMRGTVKKDALIRSLDAGSTAAEESFRSQLAERWTRPLGNFVRRSNRSFTTFGNELRNKTFDTLIDTWERRGIAYTQADVDGMIKMLNRFSGRGTLGNDTVTKFVQVVEWSPQGRVAPLQAAGQLFNANHLIRNEAWKNWASTLAAGGSIMSMAHLAGFDVTLDPRKTDFGKIVIGNTHINVWGQGQPLLRTLAQIALGEKITSSGPTDGGNILTNPRGIIEDAQNNVRKDAVLKYARSGLAPEWAALVDIWTGKDYLGEDVSFKPENLDDLAMQNAIPLAMQDAYEAFKEYGLGPEVVGQFAFSEVGGSATTYSQGPSQQLSMMPRYQDLDLKQEQEIKDFLDEVATEWEYAKRDGYDVSQAQIAELLGKKTNRPELGILGAKSLRNELPLNLERAQFVIDHQDELETLDLKYGLPAEVRRKYLTDENFQRVIEAD